MQHQESCEDDIDLEDGEIEDEGDSSQTAIPAPVVAPSTPSAPITPKNHDTHRSPPGWIRNSPRELHSSPNSGGAPLGIKPNPRMKKTPRPIHNMDRGKPWPPVKNSKVNEETVDDDWAKDLENQLQEVINRDNVSKHAQASKQPRGSPPNQDSGKEDDDYQRGRRKRKRKKYRDEEDERSSHEGKRKRRSHDGDEEGMEDDDEAMLFVRGASPSRQGFQPAHDEREDENFEFGGSSFNESYDFYDEDESDPDNIRHDKDGPGSFRRDRDDDGGPGGFRRDRDDDGGPGGFRRDRDDDGGPGGFRRDRDDDGGPGGYRRDRDDEGMGGHGRGGRGMGRGLKMNRRGARGGPAAPMGGPPMRGSFNKRGMKRGMGRGNVLMGKSLSSRPRISDRQPEGICAFFMQGKCHKSAEDCPFSHDAVPLRKMELCKFYMNDCCAKRDKCLYMHHDFPCKLYHTGQECLAGDRCKFSHGDLNDVQLNALVKHLETAPKDLLGQFPRLTRDGVLNMLRERQPKGRGRKIPSLMDMSIHFNPDEEGRSHSSPDEGEDGSRTPMAGSPFDSRRGRRAGSPDSVEREPRDQRDRKESRDREPRDQRPPRDQRNFRDQREPRDRDQREPRDRDQRERDSRDRRNDEEPDSKRRDHEHERRDRHRDHQDHRDHRSKFRDRRRRWNSPEGDRPPHEDRWDARRQSRNTADKNSRDERHPGARYSFGSKDSSDPDRRGESDDKGSSSRDAEESPFDKGSPERRTPRGPSPPSRPEGAETDRGHSQDGEDAAMDGGEALDSAGLPINLPKRQRELYLRIQQHAAAVQLREAEENAEAAAEPEPEPEEPAPEDHWYSSDEDDSATITDVLKNIKYMDQKKKGSKDKASVEEPSGDTVGASPRPYTPPEPTPSSSIVQQEVTPLQTPSGVILGDLSKIQISNDISKLLQSIRYGALPSAAGSPATTPASTPATTITEPAAAPAPAPADDVPAPAPVRDPRLTVAASRDPRQRTSAPSPPHVPQTPTPRQDPRTAARPDPRMVRSDPRASSRPDPRMSRTDPRLDLRGGTTTTSPAASPAIAPSASPAGSDTPASVHGRRTSDPPAQRTSIYESALVNHPGSGDVDLRMRSDALGASDIDLRSRLGAVDLDMRTGQRDVDLRLGPGPLGDLDRDYAQSDIDLRNLPMMLPFKPAPMHAPCTEIDASEGSYPARPYKVVPITIPRPDYTNLKVTISDPQVRADPRLRRVFRLSQDEAPSTPLLGTLGALPTSSSSASTPLPSSMPPAVPPTVPPAMPPSSSPSAPLSDPRQRKMSTSGPPARPMDPRQSRMSGSGHPPPGHPYTQSWAPPDDSFDVSGGDTDLRYFSAQQNARPPWPPQSRHQGLRGGPHHQQRSYTPPPT